jgi:ankyrin repeat domain-containing protein 50
LLKASHPDKPVLYAYCQYTEKLLHSPGNFIAAFLKQMIHFEDVLPQEVENMYKWYGKQGTRPMVEEMLAVLKAKLSSYPKSFIIIDALDEYRAPQDPLLQKLVSLQDTSNIFLTTREAVWGYWLHDMEYMGFKTPMGMRFFAHTEDIQRYVRA